MMPSVHAVDLDGTLAMDVPHTGNPWAIGEPIPKMVQRIRDWLRHGDKVVIFTARMTNMDSIEVVEAIHGWLEKNGLPRLDVTATKSWLFDDFWDDKARQVIKNTGERVGN